MLLPAPHFPAIFSTPEVLASGLPVPSNPKGAAADGGDLLMAPLYVFPTPAVGSVKHPAYLLFLQRVVLLYTCVNGCTFHTCLPPMGNGRGIC